jgi:rhodanese-related sulfurtransferase
MGRLKYLALLLALLTVACGQNMGTTPRVATPTGAYQVITVTQLKATLVKKDFVLVNVHIPYAGEIQGTDLFVAYDTVEQNLTRFPADRGAKIVVYCRSGNMSKTATQTLNRLGYTNVLDVAGGMEAWEQAGYPLAANPSAK